jgi:hypothetical protein
VSEFDLWNPPPDMEGIDREPDLHVSVVFEAELIGGHVHVTVRAAARDPSVQVDHSRGGAGKLVFRPEEWAMLSAALSSIKEPAPIWLAVNHGGLTRAKKIAPAGVASLHQGQQFIELKGWPEARQPQEGE